MYSTRTKKGKTAKGSAVAKQYLFNEHDQLIIDCAKKVGMDALEAIKVVNWFWSKRLPNQLKKGKKITITGFGQFSPKRRLAITKKREYVINQIMYRKKNNYRKSASPLRWKNDESRTRFDTYELG